MNVVEDDGRIRDIYSTESTERTYLIPSSNPDRIDLSACLRSKSIPRSAEMHAEGKCNRI